MKSEERHRLKHNALADTLVDLPDVIKEQGPRVLGAVLVAMCLFFGVIWVLRQHEAGQRQQSDTLVQAIMDTKSFQAVAAEMSQSGSMPEADPIVQQSALVERNLEALDSDNKGMNQMVLLEEAKLLRSRLYFSGQPLSGQEKQDLLTRIQGTYEKLSAASEGNVLMRGMAQMGLALVAEERGDWDAAREIYRKFLSDKDAWDETQFPLVARRRLARMKDWTSPVVFAEPTAEETTSDSSDTTSAPTLSEIAEDVVQSLPMPVAEPESEESTP